MNGPIQLFNFVINGLHVFGKKNIFEKKHVLHNFAFFSFFFYLLLIFINKRPHNTFLVFDEGAIEHILGAKVWLYGFQSILWQVFIDFLFVVCLLFFL